MRFIDIGANLLDEMYDGRYNDKDYHPPDLQPVLARAWAAGLQRIIITAGSLAEARRALALAQTDDRLYCTVGCHPTRCGEFEAHPDGPEACLQELLAVLREGQALGKVVAVGECGLDYDRLHFCDAETQKKFFMAQFRLAAESGLPMFLHLRAAADDFLDIVRQHAADFPRGGVVHSFDGTADEARRILAMPQLAIGLNGCSLKTEDNLAVVAGLPLERIMLETDCPWCEVRPTHAGRRHVSAAALAGTASAKDRKKHSPECQVLEVVAGSQESEDVGAVAEAVYGNTLAMFFPAKGSA
ncbi:putative deoxyribonuclease TATDN1 [Tetrabaena socialis]|uniref:Putative deoxyribonuclease TATDN1 n=1 Tax=Tetrabaena socialis TaxID=47790 RepID=A0A2J8AAX5_9CHLO|nr:putative deoxyribonuclease TATDN1 [Tetrabaena socialis]|eukprot:PNH09665.1 putative deoxyribonuclease TATDN1 [Tetrabaena socialis]